MNVVDMGQFGPKRPSILSGLTEALQEKNKMNMQQQELSLRTQQMKNEQEYRTQELSRQLAQLQREKDKDEFTKEMQMAEHGKKVSRSKTRTWKSSANGVQRC
jgi:hypothetical protein